MQGIRKRTLALWFRTLLLGVRAVHLRGFVHGSLKPSSVR
jgi:hypothetical protein